MVGSDLKPDEIKVMFGKFKESFEKNWLDQVYANEQVRNAIRPAVVPDSSYNDEILLKNELWTHLLNTVFSWHHANHSTPFVCDMANVMAFANQIW